jgi:uncharacterized secreted protein with C-terminal beta-propeller domain
MRKAALLLVLAAALASLGASAAGDAPAAAGKSGRLKAFDSCAQLLDYVKPRAAKLAGAYGLPWLGVPGGGIGMPAATAATDAGRAAGAEATAGVDFSATNVQEEGVDEPDIVKTNGSTVFYARGDRLFAVDVRGGGKPRVVGSLQLDGGWSHELLLHGERLLVLSRGGFVGIPAPMPVARRTASMIAGPYMQQTVLSEVAVGDPAAMRVVRSLVLDAGYVSARLVGSTARIVTVSQTPQRLDFQGPDQPTQDSAVAAAKANRAVVASSKIGSWLPRFAVRGRRGETLVRKPLVGCRDVRRPAVYSGLGMLTVLTIDLRKGLAPIDTDSVLADGSTVYASPDTLYVATQRWSAQPETVGGGEPPKTTTEIHSFDISGATETHYRGSGTVPGYLLSQWSLSEHDGVLRVASTEEPSWWNPGPQEESQSFVTTLRQDGGKLVQLGQVGGLGKGERVYAVRFIGDKGYVVTFRQVDPLYTLDLAQPATPRVLGELKIPGYSAYLHPLGEDLLLGVGQEADSAGRVQGAQLSVFDVSDLRRPVRLHQRLLGSGWFSAEWDHHAFLYWPRDRLAMLPLQAADFAGAVGFRVGRAGIDEVGRVEHGPAVVDKRYAGIPVQRSLVVGGSLYTVSDAGMQASALRTFADEGWAAFPFPEPVSGGGGGTEPGAPGR